MPTTPGQPYKPNCRDRRVELYEGQGPRTCAHCSETKPASDFYAYVRTRGPQAGKIQFKSFCRPCYSIGARGRRHAKWNPTTPAASRFARYRIRQEEYDALLERQLGTCAICKARPPRCVDHDHGTGVVRGLLCQSCNTGLHMFEDERLLQAAKAYLDIT